MNQLFQSILSKYYFAVEPVYGQQFVTMIADAYLGKLPKVTKQELKKAEKRKEMSVYSSVESNLIVTNGFRRSRDIPKNSIVQINFEGPVTKEDQFCGGIGTKTLGKRLDELEDNPNVDGVLVQVDTGGGEAGYVDVIASKVETYKKPLDAFVLDVMASAGVFSFANARQITLAGPSVTVGSCGMFSTIFDYSKMLEECGLTIHQIYATKSYEKNIAIRELLEKGNEAPMRAQLDRYLEPLLKSVKRSSKNRKNFDFKKIETGAIFIGNEAINVGLADKIGTHKQAINSLRREIKSRRKITVNSNSNNMKHSEEVQALLDGKDAEIAELQATISTSTSEIETLKTENAGLKSKAESSEVLTAQVESLTTEKASLETQVQDLTKEKTDLTAANEKAATKIQELKTQAIKDSATIEALNGVLKSNNTSIVSPETPAPVAGPSNQDEKKEDVIEVKEGEDISAKLAELNGNTGKF